MRTNFAEMSGKIASDPGAAEKSVDRKRKLFERNFKGDAVVRVSRSEEGHIEIGNCNRSS